ncbi:hypothetical protein ACRRTK_016587 [Alexandromys fortis]
MAPQLHCSPGASVLYLGFSEHVHLQGARMDELEGLPLTTAMHWAPPAQEP